MPIISGSGGSVSSNTASSVAGGAAGTVCAYSRGPISLDVVIPRSPTLPLPPTSALLAWQHGLGTIAAGVVV